jgi:hypothetical protein
MRIRPSPAGAADFSLCVAPVVERVHRCRESNGQLTISHEPAHSHLLTSRSPIRAPHPFSLVPSSTISGRCLSASFSFPVKIIISAMMGSIPSHGPADAHMTRHCCPSKREKAPLTSPFLSLLCFPCFRVPSRLQPPPTSFTLITTFPSVVFPPAMGQEHPRRRRAAPTDRSSALRNTRPVESGAD